MQFLKVVSGKTGSQRAFTYRVNRSFCDDKKIVSRMVSR